MSSIDTELYETQGVVNVTYVIDRNGKGWYCSGQVRTDPDLSGTCQSEDDLVYDRGFGG